MRSIKLMLIAGTLSLLAAGSTAEAAGRGGWGWKKPINQRLGAFYTSNRAFHRHPTTTVRRHRSGVVRQYPSRQYQYPSSVRRTTVPSAAPFFRPPLIIPFDAYPGFRP